MSCLARGCYDCSVLMARSEDLAHQPLPRDDPRPSHHDCRTSPAGDQYPSASVLTKRHNRNLAANRNTCHENKLLRTCYTKNEFVCTLRSSALLMGITLFSSCGV